MKRWFRFRPSKWWDWINPFWWRRANTCEKLLHHFMEKNDFEGSMKKAILDMTLYGTGAIKFTEDAEVKFSHESLTSPTQTSTKGGR